LIIIVDQKLTVVIVQENACFCLAGLSVT